MSVMGRISVVIPNYNYGRFVGSAIGSALALEWPDVEVIVVDDGSTDHSESVICGFGSRITAIFQQNSGPRVACNAGFAASTGDVVIFLDSDDVLDPLHCPGDRRGLVPRVSARCRSRWSGSTPRGTRSAEYSREYRRVPTPAQIRHWMITTTAYPTPPGSGNAYARSFLNQLFPVDDRCGDATDSACLAAAPFLGDVVTVAKPLVQLPSAWRQPKQPRGRPTPSACADPPCDATTPIRPVDVSRSRDGGSGSVVSQPPPAPDASGRTASLSRCPATAHRQPQADVARQLRQSRWSRPRVGVVAGGHPRLVPGNADRTKSTGAMVDPAPLRLAGPPSSRRYQASHCENSAKTRR